MKDNNAQIPGAKRLNYGTNMRTGRRIVCFSVLGCALMAAVSACNWRNTLESRFHLFLRWRECMGYNRGIDAIAYDDDAATVAALSRNGGDYQCMTLNLGTDGVIQGPVFLSPSALRYIDPSIGELDCVVFLHSRRAPGGTQYLVVITTVDQDVNTDEADTKFAIRLYTFDRVWKRPSLVYSKMSDVVLRRRCLDRKRIYFGEYPSDRETSFSIRYLIGAHEGVLAGEVEDGPSASLRIREGPARKPKRG